MQGKKQGRHFFQNVLRFLPVQHPIPNVAFLGVVLESVCLAGFSSRLCHHCINQVLIQLEGELSYAKLDTCMMHSTVRKGINIAMLQLEMDCPSTLYTPMHFDKTLPKYILQLMEK